MESIFNIRGIWFFEMPYEQYKKSIISIRCSSIFKGDIKS
jgi:hypothetical protein